MAHSFSTIGTHTHTYIHVQETDKQTDRAPANQPAMHDELTEMDSAHQV